ncbi:hypothetical protein IIZ77_03065, partial [Candidatus Saccharibacteria bacterium]|nr:hypothetical protein [Candidatus Saccharibacteria bacterium]
MTYIAFSGDCTFITERGDIMYGDYFEQYIPVKYRHDSLELRTYREMEFLGRENLQLLARFWKQHAEKRAKNAETAATYEEREKADFDAREERILAKELNKIAAEAEPKPLLFEKPTFKTGSRVICFLENPDRYVSGI